MPFLRSGLWAIFMVGLGLGAQALGALPERNLKTFCQDPASACPALELNGDWAFQKGQLLSSQELAEAGATSVPGSWNATPMNPWSPLWQDARGVGTFGLVLRNVPPIAGLSLQLNSVHSAYRVFWRPLNDQGPDRMIFQLGWQESKPIHSDIVLRNDVIPLPLEAAHSDYVLVIQVANEALAKAGLRVTPRLGLAQNFQSAQTAETVQLSLLIGAMLIIAFYHLLLFQQRRSDPSALWLAIQCLAIAAHTASYRGIMAFLWPEPSYALTLIRTWMIYLPHVIGPLAFYGFISVHFPLVRHPSARYVLGLPAALIALLLFTPLSFVSRLYGLIFLPVLTLFVIFIFWRCAATAHRDPKFRWILGGIVMLGLAGIHDAFAGAKYRMDLGVIAWAEVAFIMMQGGMLGKRFAEAYRAASRSRRELEQEVKRQTRDIQSILDTIQQGILTIRDADLKLGHDYSRYMERYFQKSIATHDFRKVLDQAVRLSGDVKDQIIQALVACLGEESIAFDLNQALLPHELAFLIDNQERFFEIDWSPVLDAQGRIEKMLVCLRDVTEIRLLRDQTQQNEEDMRIMHELLNIPEDRFKAFLKRMNDHLGESRTLVQSLEANRPVDRKEAIRQIFMNIHTVKGSARTLQLKAIAAASHDLEQEIASLRQHSQAMNLGPLKDKFARVTDIMDRYQNMSQQKLGWDYDEDRVRLPRSLVIRNLKLLANLQLHQLPPDAAQDVLDLESSLYVHCAADLGHALTEASRGLDSMARDLGKEPPRMEVVAPGIMLTEAGQQLIQAIFTHILRNALDHGLEEPEERKRKGKPRQGLIQVEAQMEGPWLRLDCFDDGRGLDLDQIQARALEKGLIAPIWKGDDAAIAALIFKAGLSTKAAVTDISGRGVGMDAVQSFLERIGGKVTVALRGGPEARPFAAFTLSIYLPQAFWWVGHSPEELSQGA
jgi:HPt (histidine-containing phosphotransfer) domain-containing protein/PAS domain-containing protein